MSGLKTDEQRAGISRALAASHLALDAIRDRLRSGTPTTSEELRQIAWDVLAANGCAPQPELTIASGAQSGSPDGAGTGPIADHVPIVVDIFPQDVASGCWGDMARTYCRGEAPAELQHMHATVCSVLAAVKASIRPGRTGHELAVLAHGMFTEAGYAIGKSRPGGPAAFPHMLGHGVGLEPHEAPFLDLGGGALVAGDVVAVEPGLYRSGWGGVRIEDVVLVTPDGWEQLTSAPYELIL